MEIRPLAIALIRHSDRLFVMECFDSVKNETFYRPLGGGIEFGERGEVALRREFREEMSTELSGIQYLQMFENIFVCNGVEGHEIVLLFKADFEDERLYSEETVTCNESGVPFIAKWVSIEEFRLSRQILYPDGLMEYLKKC